MSLKVSLLLDGALAHEETKTALEEVAAHPTLRDRYTLVRPGARQQHAG